MKDEPEGYSGTPLSQKLGLKPGMSVAVLNAPQDFDDTLGDLPADVVLAGRLGGHKDLVMVFVTRRADLVRRLPAIRRAVAPAGMIWVAWPKRTAPKRTDVPPSDVTEDVIRDVVLPTGLVDVKVCAVDATWSGLKLVVRKALR